jgi:hypothetical protein
MVGMDVLSQNHDIISSYQNTLEDSTALETEFDLNNYLDKNVLDGDALMEYGDEDALMEYGDEDALMERTMDSSPNEEARVQGSPVVAGAGSDAAGSGARRQEKETSRCSRSGESEADSNTTENEYGWSEQAVPCNANKTMEEIFKHSFCHLEQSSHHTPMIRISERLLYMYNRLRKELALQDVPTTTPLLAADISTVLAFVGGLEGDPEKRAKLVLDLKMVPIQDTNNFVAYLKKNLRHPIESGQASEVAVWAQEGCDGTIDASNIEASESQSLSVMRPSDIRTEATTRALPVMTPTQATTLPPVSPQDKARKCTIRQKPIGNRPDGHKVAECRLQPLYPEDWYENQKKSQIMNG